MGNIWTLFVGFLENVLLTFFTWFRSASIPGAAGLAIILFTILARLVILPLTLKSLQSTRKMQELQPQLKELQRKYGKDQQKVTEETMKLYKEYKVTPVGGCLPMLIQLPIFLGVYQAVLHLTQSSPAGYAVGSVVQALANNGVNVGNLSPLTIGQPQLAGGFLWMTDLGKPDPFYILGVLSLEDEAVAEDEPTEQALSEVRRQLNQSNPRRRKARRS